MRKSRTPTGWLGALLLLGTPLVAGCPLDRPRIEDRWTRVDLVAASLGASQSVPPGPRSITVSADVTYRSILTGFAVAELRASAVSTTAVTIEPGANRVAMARDIQAVLQSSVSLGRGRGRQGAGSSSSMDGTGDISVEIRSAPETPSIMQ